MRFPGYVLAGEARVWTLIFLGEDAPSAVLVVADFNVYALNASTGALLWSYTAGYGTNSSPAVANGVVYVGWDDGNVYAFGLPRGNEAQQGATSKRPDLTMLRPEFNLKVSER